MSVTYSKEEVLKDFEKCFAYQAQAAYFSPGRINLIGEHTDYNGGHVFPAAISLGTYAAAAKREDGHFRLYSANFPDQGVHEFEVSDLSFKKEHGWANYAKGVLLYLAEAGHDLTSGFDLFIYGTIPNGAGLSSSASLELLVGIIAEDLYELDLDRLDLVKIGKACENHYMGVNSGIMDQFAVGMGQEGQAIYLDTESLDYDLAPLDLEGHIIVIMNTNKRRELASSKYNERRSQCEAALSDLQKGLGIQSLGQLNEESLDQYAYLIQDPINYRRARHAVSENQRTRRAKEALQAGDLARFGRLMNASHLSLEGDYEVTGKELDCLVHTAWKLDGVLGARMTGAGFGGCALALIKEDKLEDFIQAVKETYLEQIGYEPSFYLAHISGSSHKF